MLMSNSNKKGLNNENNVLKQQVYEIQQRLGSIITGVRMMASLTFHEILLVHDRVCLYLLIFNKKNKRMCFRQQWELQNIVDLQKLVNNYFYIITQVHEGRSLIRKIALYQIIQPQNDKYAINIIIKPQQFHSYFQHQVSKNIFQFQLFSSETQLYLYQFTNHNKTGDGYFKLQFQKQNNTYKITQQKKNLLYVTKSFVNSHKRILIKRPSAKASYFIIQNFPSNVFFIIGLPRKEQYLAYTQYLQFFSPFKNQKIQSKKIYIPGQPNPTFDRIQVKQNLLILQLNPKNIKVVTNPVLILQIQPDSSKVIGSDQGKYEWIFGNDNTQMIGFINKKWIKITKISMKYIIECKNSYQDIIQIQKITNNNQKEQKQLTSNEKYKSIEIKNQQNKQMIKNEKQFFADQKPSQFHISFTKNNKNKAFAQVIKKNTFPPLNQALKQLSKTTNIRQEVVCFNHNKVLNKMSKNQLRIKYLLQKEKNDKQIKRLKQQQKQKNFRQEELQKQQKLLYQTLQSIIQNTFISMPKNRKQSFSDYESLPKQNVKKKKNRKKNKNKQLQVQQQNNNSIQQSTSIFDINKTFKDIKQNPFLSKEFTQQQKPVSQENNNTQNKQEVQLNNKQFLLNQRQKTKLDNRVIQNQFYKDKTSENNQFNKQFSKNKSFNKSKLSNYMSQKPLQETIVFKPNFTDIFKTNPNDPQQKIVLYNKMHNYFQKIMNQNGQSNKQEKHETSISNLFRKQQEDINPLSIFKLNNKQEVQKQQESVFKKLSERKEKQQKKHNFVIPNIFSPKNISNIQKKFNKKNKQKQQQSQKNDKSIEIVKNISNQYQNRLNNLVINLNHDLSTLQKQFYPKLFITCFDNKASNKNSQKQQKQIRIIIDKDNLLKGIYDTRSQLFDIMKKQFPKKIKNFFQIILDHNKNYHKQSQKVYQNNIKTLITKQLPYYPQSFQHKTRLQFNEIENKFLSAIIQSKQKLQDQNLTVLYEAKQDCKSLRQKIQKLQVVLKTSQEQGKQKVQYQNIILESMRSLKQNILKLIQQKKQKKITSQKIIDYLKSSPEHKKNKKNQVLKAEKMKKKIKGHIKQESMKMSMIVPKHIIKRDEQENNKKENKTKRKKSANSYVV